MSKALLITGCSKGLGYALANHFAAHSYRIYAVGRTPSSLEALAKQFPNLIPVIADINLASDRQKIASAVQEDSISIIHNAAIVVPKAFQEIDEDLLRQHFETNLLAPLLITRALLPRLTKQRVLHITSGAATLTLYGLLPYCVTKSALEHSTHCLNEELNTQKIFFANLRPGVVDTPTQASIRNSDTHDLPNRDFYATLHRNKQLLPPSLVAHFVDWVINQTDNETFCNTTWSIYDEWHQAHWLPAGQSVRAYR